jgi:hypothetical protein
MNSKQRKSSFGINYKLIYLSPAFWLYIPFTFFLMKKQKGFEWNSEQESILLHQSFGSIKTLTSHAALEL